MGKKKNKNNEKKNKINLVFDENKRKEFLCGFRKRKLERKKKAQEELQQLLKNEKRRIKQENKESYKKLVLSSRPIPDIEQLLQEEYEDEDVNVKIVELSSDTLQKKDLVIGENKPKVANENTEKKKSHNLMRKIPGMDSDVGSEPEESDTEETQDNKLKTKKEVKRLLKKQATKKVQKSKVFQMKNKLERVKNKKKSHQKKHHMKGKNDPKKSKKQLGRRKH
ncbi:nucleolar protein 12 [Galleria mellonella]|uniref:Nucleolar protein 12 n=1 Tax=Galleria mellonella TaxID=7137 RepID=A0A6J1WFW7_GALME|nr:nucleolar protein 12 [Galleria mellonella]